MSETQITVHYERKLSDHDYGSEGMSLSWSGPHDQAYGDIAEALRVQVLSFLAQSRSPAVARAAKAELKPSLDDEVMQRGTEWSLSNAAAEEHAIRAEYDEEELPEFSQ
jgi:hypothetical protein